MTLTEAVEFLIASGYVGKNNSSKLIFLRKTYEELNVDATGAVTAIAVVSKGSALLPGGVDWETYYMNFISECKVPADATSNDGLPYALSTYSVAGMKAFRKAMMQGIKYNGLVGATTLYYASNKPFKMAIGRYMETESWRTDYANLANAIKENKLEEHVKHTTGKPNTFTRIG